MNRHWRFWIRFGVTAAFMVVVAAWIINPQPEFFVLVPADFCIGAFAWVVTA